MRAIVVGSVLMLFLAGATPGFAKEPTRKLIISGGGIAGQVEMMDSATLALSNVYTGSFLADSAPSASPSTRLPRYEISFYLPEHGALAWLESLRRPRLRRAYVVFFVVDAVRHAGYVYLPGPGDTWSAWNHGVIIREGQEGQWHMASEPWSARIAAAIARARKIPAPHCPSTDGAALIGPRDAIFADVLALRETLEAHGIHVLCAYHSTFDGLLGQHAAGITTNLGSFALIAFPTSSDVERVRLTSIVKDGQVVTILRGPDPRQRVDSMFGADKTDFLVHGRWLIDTWAQQPLRTALDEALRAS